ECPPLGGTWISARPPSSQAGTKEEECPPWGAPGSPLARRPAKRGRRKKNAPPWGAPGSPLARRPAKRGRRKKNAPLGGQLDVRSPHGGRGGAKLIPHALRPAVAVAQLVADPGRALDERGHALIGVVGREAALL